VNGAGPSFPATPALVTRNRTEEGLGLPLPAGRIAVFGERAGRPLLLGEGFIRDRAVGEEVEIELPTNASGVRSEISLVREGRRSQDFIVTVSNDRAVPASYELEMFAGEGERVRPERRLGRRNGHPLWAVTIPANSRASLRYRVYAAPESD
jgi:hypothetical protein